MKCKNCKKENFGGTFCQYCSAYLGKETERQQQSAYETKEEVDLPTLSQLTILLQMILVFYSVRFLIVLMVSLGYLLSFDNFFVITGILTVIQGSIVYYIRKLDNRARLLALGLEFILIPIFILQEAFINLTISIFALYTFGFDEASIELFIEHKRKQDELKYGKNVDKHRKELFREQN